MTELCEIANENVSLFQAKIIRFINSQIERIEAKEISEGTVCDYVTGDQGFSVI